MELKDSVENYKLPVEESAWETIVNDAQLVRFNRRKRWQRICLLGVVPAVVVAVVVATVLLASSPKKSVEEPDKTVAPQEVTVRQTEPVTQAKSEKVPQIRTSESLPMQKEAVPTTTNFPSQPVLEEIVPAVAPAASKPSAPSAPIAAKIEKRAPEVTAVSSSVSKPAKSVSVSSVKSQDDNAHSSEEPETPTNNYQLFIPNAFTPNGDGVNDLFKVEADFAPLTFEIAIYSRKGDLVFLNKDMKLGWDGSFRGRDLPSEVYNYIVKFTNPEGKQSTRRGQVTLIR